MKNIFYFLGFLSSLISAFSVIFLGYVIFHLDTLLTKGVSLLVFALFFGVGGWLLLGGREWASKVKFRSLGALYVICLLSGLFIALSERLIPFGFVLIAIAIALLMWGWLSRRSLKNISQ